MKVKHCLKDHEISVECQLMGTRYANVDVAFEHPDGTQDETEFTVMDPITKSGIYELDTLFSDFCKENQYTGVTITNIRVSLAAPTEQELYALETA